MELMDGGAFTPMLEELQGQYSEEFCKYSLYGTLKGLLDLHTQNIIHRDIKSDNILVKAAYVARMSRPVNDSVGSSSAASTSS